MYCKKKKFQLVQVNSIYYLTLDHNDQVGFVISLIQMRNETGDRSFVFLLKNDAACSGASEREPDN